MTVVIPAYNAESTIGATVATVLAQTHERLEVIVVDDGSTDATAETVAGLAERDERVLCLRQPNAGVATARNAGIARASGSYLAFLDADDLWHPTKIEKQLAVVAASREPLTFVYTGYRIIDGEGRIAPNHRPLADVSGHTVLRQLATTYFTNVSSILAPTAVIRSLGGYDPKLRASGAEGAEDFLLQLRLADRGAVGCVREALVGYRIHAGNMSRDYARAVRSNLHAIDVLSRELDDVPDWVVKLARARVSGFSALLLAGGEPSDAAMLSLRLLRDQPLYTLSSLGSVFSNGVRFLLTKSTADPALGRPFLEVAPETVPWTGHLMTGRDKLLALAEADRERARRRAPVRRLERNRA